MLESHIEPLEALRTLARVGNVTLVLGARDEAHNNAVALQTLLLSLSDRPSGAKVVRSLENHIFGF